MGVLMSVVELGPNDGEYEWRHIMANKTTHNRLGDIKLQQFAAKERRTVEERKRHHDAALKSKRMGTYAEVDSSTFTFKSFFQQPTCFIQYIGAEPLRNIDLYASLLVENKLHDSNRKRLLQLAEFIEFAPQLMGIVELRNDRILTLQYANSFTADKLGVPVDKLTGLDVTHSAPFPVIDDYIKLYQDSRKESAPLKRDIFEEDPGMLYWTATVSCISYDKENNVSLHAFLITDKSDIRRVERELKAHKDSLEETVRKRTVELQEKELRFSSLVSNAPNIILTIDHHGLVHDNASLLIGKHFYTLVVEGEELMAKIRTLFETTRSFILEVKLIDADIWLNLNVGYIDSNSAIIVATGILHFEKIKQLSEELHNALTTKSRFLANMSHEIRTPLSGIIGMSRILVESGLTMDQTECVATIQNCGETLLSVINSILDYTKLEANGMLIDKSEISLLQTVEDSLYTVLPSVQAKGLELIFDIDPRVPDRVLVDPLRLKQVIINLLNNAVKFTEEGYILVSVRATEIGDMWKLWFLVKDTGCGVLAESQGKLFQMFSQVDVSTTRRYGGTGIGLALAKRLLELMDGDISMDSSGVSGEGCTFRFTLLSATAPFAPISPSSVSSPKWLVASAKILIVGKCKIANEVLKKRLEGKGLTTIEIVAPNSAKSCSSPRDQNLIIFYDMNQLAPNERPQMLNLPNIITIFMDYTRPPNFDNDYPDCQFLRKPIKESALIRCLREICAHFDTKQKQSQSLDVILRESGKNIQPQNQVYPLSILVVEDNEINQKVARRVFQHIGYPTISIANHGREALEMIEKMGMPDIIFMDVQMPILDGMETTKIIRSQYPNSDTQIVAMTANAFPAKCKIEDRINCLQAGMNDFLTKPIRQEQVQNVLQKCYKLLTMTNSNIHHHNPRFGLLHVNV